MNFPKDVPVKPKVPQLEMITKCLGKAKPTLNQSEFGRLEKKIKSQSDIEVLISSEAYVRLMGFILKLNDAAVNKRMSESESDKVKQIIQLLDTLSNWIDEIPAVEQPQRFGNKAFRTWHEKLQKESLLLLSQLLPKESHAACAEVNAYFMQSFGHATRIDYGTGHEMNFIAFLYCLYVLDVLTEELLEQTALHVIERYFKLVQKLQKSYRLEPAGSHGVWGLDDYFFLPYIIGSAQLLGHARILPKSILDTEVVKCFAKDYLYLSAIEFILETKTGPFFEHSPMLYDMTAIPSWEKVNRGLFKMYIAEVLSKVPIMQHFEFGTFLPWRQADPSEK